MSQEHIQALRRLHDWAVNLHPGVTFTGDHPIALARSTLAEAAGETLIIPLITSDEEDQDAEAIKNLALSMTMGSAAQRMNVYVALCNAVDRLAGWVAAPLSEVREIVEAWERWRAAETALCCDEPTEADERTAALHRTAFAILMHSKRAALRPTPSNERG
jgi:hypothetical protein